MKLVLSVLFFLFLLFVIFFGKDAAQWLFVGPPTTRGVRLPTTFPEGMIEKAGPQRIKNMDNIEVRIAVPTSIRPSTGPSTRSTTRPASGVPISHEALRLLKPAKPHVPTYHPGPATALWIEALKEYDAKNYQGAAEILGRLVRLQAKRTELDGTANKVVAVEFFPAWESGANPYVADLLKRALAKAK